MLSEWTIMLSEISKKDKYWMTPLTQAISSSQTYRSREENACRHGLGGENEFQSCKMKKF